MSRDNSEKKEDIATLGLWGLILIFPTKQLRKIETHKP